MDVNELLKGTEYEEDIDCISQYIERSRIREASQLDELPGRQGSRICGHNTYALVARLKDRYGELVADDNDFRRSLADDEAYHALKKAGHTDPAQLGAMTDEDLDAIPGIGRTRRNRIRKVVGGPPPAEETQ